MISRKAALTKILEQIDNNVAVVVPLGRASRDAYWIGEQQRKQIFFCLGSMGSVIPFALGLAISQPEKKIWAIEGDGSLLMNLGVLATSTRYKCNNLKIIINNNKLYESTGGQPSQSCELELDKIIKATGLKTVVISDTETIGKYLNDNITDVLIIKTMPEEPSERIDDTPLQIKQRFQNWLLKKDEKVITV